MTALREDLSRQRDAVTQARAVFADRLEVLAELAADEGAPEVAVECRALVRRLTSTAKRPPAVDTADLMGALSGARRHGDAFTSRYDEAERDVRSAERLLDAALYDLATAGGAGGAGL